MNGLHSLRTASTIAGDRGTSVRALFGLSELAEVEAAGDAAVGAAVGAGAGAGAGVEAGAANGDSAAAGEAARGGESAGSQSTMVSGGEPGARN
jgi:hypothetical protein